MSLTRVFLGSPSRGPDWSDRTGGSSPQNKNDCGMVGLLSRLELLHHSPRLGSSGTETHRHSLQRKSPVSQTKTVVGWEHHIGGGWTLTGLMGVTSHLCASVSSPVNGDTVKAKSRRLGLKMPCRCQGLMVFPTVFSGRPSIPREQSPQWTLSYRHVTFSPQTKDRGCGDGKVSQQGMSSCPKGQTKGLRGGERQPQAPCEQGLAQVAQNLKLSPRLAQASGKEPNLQLISQDLLINHHGPLLSAWALSGRNNIGRTFIYSPTSHSGKDT